MIFKIDDQSLRWQVQLIFIKYLNFVGFIKTKQ